MDNHRAVMIAAVNTIGISVQWIAWRLCDAGLILFIIAEPNVGPLSGWIELSRDFGELLEPVITLCVAIILFEDGISLRWHELKESGAAINGLVTLGRLLTFLMGSAAAHNVGGLSWAVARVFGEVMVVTGPPAPESGYIIISYAESIEDATIPKQWPIPESGAHENRHL